MNFEAILLMLCIIAIENFNILIFLQCVCWAKAEYIHFLSSCMGFMCCLRLLVMIRHGGATWGSRSCSLRQHGCCFHSAWHCIPVKNTILPLFPYLCLWAGGVVNVHSSVFFLFVFLSNLLMIAK